MLALLALFLLFTCLPTMTLHCGGLCSHFCFLSLPMLPRPVCMFPPPLGSGVSLLPGRPSVRAYIQGSAAHVCFVLCCTYLFSPLMFGNMPCSALNMLECLAQTFVYSRFSKYVESNCIASFAMRKILFLFHNLGIKLCMQKKLKPREK